MRTTPGPTAAAILVGAVVIRIPAFLAVRHLSFDDGVYGASAVALRAGGLPFRDVFSSQGPLFLPLVWLSDLLGGRTLDAPRLLAVASGVALVAATWAAARALRLSPAAAALAAGLVATSGSVLWVTGPLTSDGPGLALATGAVAAALGYRREPGLGRAVLAGGLLGAALSVKSLLVGAAVPVGWALLPGPADRPDSNAGGGRWLPLLAAVAAAGAVSLVVALPWGLGNVWDQAFRYHLEAAGPRTPVRNLRKVVSTLGDRDLPLLVAVGLAAVATAARPGGRSTVGRSPGPRLVAAWLGATVAVLALEHPLWRSHASHLVPALALLVAGVADRFRRGGRRGAGRWPAGAAALAVAAVLVVPYHLVHLSEVLWPAPPGPALAAARADLRALPAGAEVISDDPGVVWRAGRRTPDDLVDTSMLRIAAGRITPASLARAAAGGRVCALLVWSHRFGDLGALPGLLRSGGYDPGPAYGGPRVLWRRAACHP